MKKIIGLCVIGGLIATTGTAQIKKGTVLLGGQIAGGNYKSTSTGIPVDIDTKNKAANFQISAGTAIKENRIIGIYGGYGTAKYNYYPNSIYQDVRSRNYNAGVFYRQYKNITKKLYAFGEANIGYYGANERSNYIIPITPAGVLQTKKTNGAVLGITPGAAYQVCKKLQVELTIPALLSFQYQASKETYSNSTNSVKENSFNANAGTQSGFLNNIGIGFKFTL